MKIKTSELSGIQLDWAVAKAEGLLDDCNTWLHEASLQDVAEGSYHPSENWELVGVIIEREGICVVVGMTIYDWQAYIGEETDKISGDTPLIAAARCYVTSKLGEEINIPEELI
jgi:hypothetical protein